MQWKKTIAWFYCMIMKMEIPILYHVIVNSQLNRDNLTRCYVQYMLLISDLSPSDVLKQGNFQVKDLMFYLLLIAVPI